MTNYIRLRVQYARCVMEHRHKLGAIHLLASPRSGRRTLEEATEMVDSLLTELRGSRMTHENLTCVLCNDGTGSGRRATHTFSLCGHRFDDDCIRSMAVGGSLPVLPLRCPKCAAPVASRDLQACMDSEAFQQFCEAAVQAHILSDVSRRQLAVVQCPSMRCSGLLPRKAGYTRCPLCVHHVCGDCGAVEEAFHQGGKSCEQARAAKAAHLRAQEEAEKKKRREEREARRRYAGLQGKLRLLVQAAEAFLQASWPTDMPDISRTDINPGLHVNSPSVRLFLEGLSQRSLHEVADLVRHGFMTWHGTSDVALPMICHNGFDPSKRRGQAYGPGEVRVVMSSSAEHLNRKAGNPNL